MIFFNNHFWDQTFTLFKIEGPDARNFLNSQTTFDVLGIQEGCLFRTCWLSPIGRFKSLLEVRLSGECIEFLVLSGNNKELIDGLNKVIFPLDRVKITECGEVRRLQILSMEDSWKETETQWISNEIPENFMALKPADKSILQEWKIRQGLPCIFNNILEKCNPFELGLSDFVNLKKGCYLGQETLSKVNNMGKLRYKLRLFESLENINSGDSLILSSKNSSNENVGIVYTSMRSRNCSSIGLALIRGRFASFENLDLQNELGKIKLINPIGFKGI